LIVMRVLARTKIVEPSLPLSQRILATRRHWPFPTFLFFGTQRTLKRPFVRTRRWAIGTRFWGLRTATRTVIPGRRSIYNRSVIYVLMSATAAAPFTAIAEPARRQILELLREGERSVNELVQRLNLSQPGVSKHLRVLREAGLVRVRPDGRRRWYGLRAEPLAELDEWLAPYRVYWGGRLDALERHLDQQED
jgi:DNA-binding transcriptional ArsR family regulator